MHKRFGDMFTKPFLYTIFTHTQNVAGTCSTAQLRTDNEVPPTMQNTHYRRDLIICTELPVLSHTLKILFEHRSLRPQKLLLLPKQSLCP